MPPLIADVTLTTETLVVVTALLGTVGGVVAVLFGRLEKSWAERMADTVELCKSYREIAQEATIALETEDEVKRQSEGTSALPVLAAVVPEHGSPVSIEQQDAADLQTLRARLVRAKLRLGHPARVTGPPETGEQRTKRRGS